MAFGPEFLVSSVVITSTTDANDFYFAGFTKSFTNGTNTKSFSTKVGFVMIAITSD